MSDLVLSNLTIQGHPVGLFFPDPTPSDEVTIGTQTWKNSNLAIDDGGTGIGTYRYTYDGVTQTGYTYNYDAATRIASNIEGWHLATNSDWLTLIEYISGSGTGSNKLACDNLRTTEGWGTWNGLNTYGFNLTPNYNFNGRPAALLLTDRNSARGNIEFDQYTIYTSIYSNNLPVRLVKDT
jgi:uncharacterized protein (TIGR02145 family)